MCFFGGGSSRRDAPITAPPVAPAPTRADEENKNAVNEQLELARRRKGAAATIMTGGLGDASYGANVEKPRVTALGG